MFKLEGQWQDLLGSEFAKDYMLSLQTFLKKEADLGKVIYPPEGETFFAFNQTAFDKVKVVILGQDPYHGAGQAQGLAFSVREGVKVPPSLKNIYKELASDMGFEVPSHGSLVEWAAQGVFLLNSTLTVEHSLAASHQKHGWEEFTDIVIDKLNEEKENLAFLLWGAPAQKKGKRIDTSKHLVLKAPHPSPLSSYRGFFGCKHFSQANDYLKGHGKKKINWKLSTTP